MRELEDVQVERNVVKDSEECTALVHLLCRWKLCALLLEMNCAIHVIVGMLKYWKPGMPEDMVELSIYMYIYI